MICRKCYARLHARAVNCRKKSLGEVGGLANSEEVRSHQPAPPQEEAEVSLVTSAGG